MMAVLAACLVGCVVVLVWPRAGALVRLSGGRPAFRLPRLRVPVVSLGRRGVLGVSAAGAVAGLLLGGPVAAFVGAVYAAVGMTEWVRRDKRKRARASRAVALDGLSGLVADLRAGLPPVSASHASAGAGLPSVFTGSRTSTGAGLSSVFTGSRTSAGAELLPDSTASGASVGDGRITRLTAAVWRLAERTGAPAADLLERIEADARAADRAAASASAQAAGAQVTALLLAALPVGGIGLGYSIGADPLHILLRTPLGAACASGAVLLQCGGMQWSRRLVEGAR